MDLSDFIHFLEVQKLFSRQERVLLAVSGGIDSTVMAHLFYKAKLQFFIAHCNFGLRGEESDEDLEFVKTMSIYFNVPFFSEKFDTSGFAAQNGISTQMAARDLRYTWFEKIRRENKFDYIATAHHLDDQVETFLINLIRGTGIAGLHGIPVKNGKVIRPLMFAFRRDIEQYAAKNKLSYRTDQSNNEIKYLRNKIRHEIVPLMCGINPEFTNVLTESIRRIGDFEQIGNDVLDKWCKEILKPDGQDYFIDIKQLLSVTPIESYAWRLLSPFGFNETQIINILDCLDKQYRTIFLSADYQLVKERKRLVIRWLTPKIPDQTRIIDSFVEKKMISKPLKLVFSRIKDPKKFTIPVSGNIASLDFSKLQFPLLLRKWRHGDSFYPLGMKKRKKLSDFFIDQKFSLRDKEQTWLVCSGNDIIWIVGHRIDHRFRVTSATREILCIVTGDR
ncbi:MAG: tRNA lysidine(34) synthetase TilS [Bacteroidales bacterium]|nr:tRNA lysidine(34) synthetase TilS [Bacteroidales bacterium]